jgi:hypothetical protein
MPLWWSIVSAFLVDLSNIRDGQLWDPTVAEHTAA